MNDLITIIVLWFISMKGAVLGFISFEGLRINNNGFESVGKYIGRFIVTLSFMTFLIEILKDLGIKNIFEYSFVLSGLTFYILNKLNDFGKNYINDLNIKKIIKQKLKDYIKD